jgi:glycosidase
MIKLRIGLLVLFTGLFFTGSAYSQMPPAITITPADATAWEPLTLTYDPSLGCTPSGKGSLVGAPKIMMHSACFYLEYIDSWGSSWGQTTIDYNATPKDGSHATTDLTPNGDGTYSITFVPGQYYGAPQGSIIIGLTMVFNGGSWDAEGKDPSRGGCGDFYVPLHYNPGLFVQFTLPKENSLFVRLNDSIEVEVVGNESDSLFLYLDDILIRSTDKDTLTETVYVTEMGEHWIKTLAKDDSDQVEDSIFYYVTEEVAVEDLPDGIMEGINHINDSTVTLVLFAPGKEFIYLLGDFNDWSVDNDFLMKRTTDEYYYWITLDSLLPDTFYRYQYYIDGEIKVGDPFAEMVLDPNNDPYISSETYPGKIPYPTGKTSDLVTVFHTTPEPYEWKTTDFTPPENEELIIYELLIRDFIGDHSYKILIDTLHYLEYLGVNAIELMPVNEFEGNLSWGYNPSYYFAPDKYYGPKKELQRFIDTCHARGIAVIIDMVLNHSFGQSPMVKMYWDVNRPAANSPWFNQEPKHDFNVGYDFNHESAATQRFVDRVNKFWLSEYKADGFRFDLSKGFTQKNTLGDVEAWGHYDASRVALWKKYADSIWKVNPDAYVILEHFADNDEEQELTSYGMMVWGNAVYNYGRAGMGWNYDNKSNFSWGSYKTRGFDKPHLVTYMESHDEERQMREILDWGNYKNPNYNIRDNLSLSAVRAELSAAFFFTIPGPKMLWQFGELGYDYSINYDCRTCNKPIRWDYYDDPNRQRLYQAYSTLIHLKKNNEAFNSEDYTIDVVDTIKTIHIEHSSMDVTIFGNFDTWPKTIDPAFTQTGTWYDYFTGDSLVVTDVNMPITLEQSEYHIYTTKMLATPGIISAPVAMDVKVIGSPALGEMVYGDYRYFDQNGDPEGATKFQWYRGVYENGTSKEAIPGATDLSYTITANDWGHYLFIEVTPVAQLGTILEGIPQYGVMDVATAIESEVQDDGFRIFPNPSAGQINIRFQSGANPAGLAIYDLFGKMIYETKLPAGQDNKLIEGLDSGVYLIRISQGKTVYTKRMVVL